MRVLMIFFTAIAAIIGQCSSIAWLEYVFKPATTLLILALALAGPSGQPAPYRRWIASGLAASLLGDIFLMLPGSWFIHGLLSFLVAHVLYLRAFCGPGVPGKAGLQGAAVPVRLASRGLPFAIYGLLSAGLLLVLYPALPTALVVPVLVYVVFLAAMAAQAAARGWLLGTRPSAMAAAGGAFFVLSDASLAFNKFHTPCAAAPVVVLGTYWLAQTLIAMSVRQPEDTYSS